MPTQSIFSKNAAYQKFEVLLTNRNKRHKYHEFIVEGVRNINEAVKNNWRINSFIFPRGKKLSDWASGLLRDIQTSANYELAEDLMSDLSGKENPSELIAVVSMKDNSENEMPMPVNPLFVLFDRPSNKGNLGTLIRSCDAFGANRLIITGHGVDIHDPEVIGASMGSFFNLPFTILSGNTEIDSYISQLKQKYPLLKIIGTTAHKQTNIDEVDLTTPVLFLIGNETDGLNRHYIELSDIMATIPMRETSSASSLNVSCAATVLLYEARRQRMNPI